MRRPPPESTRPYTLFPYSTLFRSENDLAEGCEPAFAQTGCRLFHFPAHVRKHRLHCTDHERQADEHQRNDHTGGRERDLYSKRLQILADPAVGGIDGGQRNACDRRRQGERQRSEEHTSELQSLMRISYAVFCLKIKITTLIVHV